MPNTSWKANAMGSSMNPKSHTVKTVTVMEAWINAVVVAETGLAVACEAKAVCEARAKGAAVAEVDSSQGSEIGFSTLHFVQLCLCEVFFMHADA